MKKIEIAVCDDEQIYIDRIVKYIEVYSEEYEIDINIKTIMQVVNCWMM